MHIKKDEEKVTQKSYLRVLVEMATMPSGHCSDAKPDAYSNVSYDKGVK